MPDYKMRSCSLDGTSITSCSTFKNKKGREKAIKCKSSTGKAFYKLGGYGSPGHESLV